MEESAATEAGTLTEADKHKLNQVLCEYFVSQNMDALVEVVTMSEDSKRRQAVINYLFSGLSASQQDDLLLKAKTVSADGDFTGEFLTSNAFSLNSRCLLILP